MKWLSAYKHGRFPKSNGNQKRRGNLYSTLLQQGLSIKSVSISYSFSPNTLVIIIVLHISIPVVRRYMETARLRITKNWWYVLSMSLSFPDQGQPLLDYNLQGVVSCSAIKISQLNAVYANSHLIRSPLLCLYGYKWERLRALRAPYLSELHFALQKRLHFQFLRK